MSQFFSNFSLSKPMVAIIMALIIFAWIGMSAVLVFHWRRYSMKERFVTIAESVYFLVSAVLIVLAAGFFIAI